MNGTASGTLRLYGAVGDALAGRAPGFSSRRAALASRFARYRGGDAETVAASWCAGLLAEIGHVAVTVAPDESDRRRRLALADAPLHGARLAAAIPELPPGTADMIRWHREHDDGTGFPDRLRWDGIPADAGALGLANAFLEAVDDLEEPRAPGEALFAVIGESGRRFRVELVRTFREFVAAETETLFRADDPVLPALDEDSLVAELAIRLDARVPATSRRSERLVEIAAGLAERLALDAARARRLARLLALGRATPDVTHDAFDPLSRFARDRRTRDARRAADIAASVPQFEADAPHLAASAAWFEDGGGDALGAVLALALAIDALPPLEAPRMVAAASGTQFDPDAVRAYLTAIGAPT